MRDKPLTKTKTAETETLVNGLQRTQTPKALEIFNDGVPSLVYCPSLESEWRTRVGKRCDADWFSKRYLRRAWPPVIPLDARLSGYLLESLSLYTKSAVLAIDGRERGAYKESKADSGGTLFLNTKEFGRGPDFLVAQA